MEDLKTPWRLETNDNGVYSSSLVFDNERNVLAAWDGLLPKTKKRWTHIIACVNALDGLNPQAIPELVKILIDFKRALFGMNGSNFDEPIGSWGKELEEIFDALAKVKKGEGK